MKIQIPSLEERINFYYEQYKDGKIDLEEKEHLIQKAKDGEYLRYVLENFDVDSNATPYERFDTIKKYLYQECSNGRITVDERENLISIFREDVWPSA